MFHRQKKKERKKSLPKRFERFQRSGVFRTQFVSCSKFYDDNKNSALVIRTSEREVIVIQNSKLRRSERWKGRVGVLELNIFLLNQHFLPTADNEDRETLRAVVMSIILGFSVSNTRWRLLNRRLNKIESIYLIICMLR